MRVCVHPARTQHHLPRLAACHTSQQQATMNTQLSLLQAHCRLNYSISKPAAIQKNSTRVSVATTRPAVLQSLDLLSAQESFVQGLGVMPAEWGVPAGHLYSEGKYVCHIPALEHLGISLETGPFELGRDHYSSALLSAVLNKLERRHVGNWLFDAARSAEAAYLFESHSVLRGWLYQLAEQRHGKNQCLLVELGNPAAAQAADWLQSLSSCFGKELHNISVAFKTDTAAAAHELLFTWLLELPPASSNPITLQTEDTTLVGLTAHQIHTKNFLVNIADLLPHKPTVLVKQLPAPGSAAFNARIISSIPSAAALAGAAAHSPGSHAAAGIAVAAGWVDGTACICMVEPVLSKTDAAAAMHMIMAAKQGLKLNSSQCASAIDAAAVAAVTACCSAAAAAAGAIECDIAAVAAPVVERCNALDDTACTVKKAAGAVIDIDEPLNVPAEINCADVGMVAV